MYSLVNGFKLWGLSKIAKLKKHFEKEYQTKSSSSWKLRDWCSVGFRWQRLNSALEDLYQCNLHETNSSNCAMQEKAQTPDFWIAAKVIYASIYKLLIPK